MYVFIRFQHCCDFGQKRQQTASIKKRIEEKKRKPRKEEWNFFRTGGAKEIQKHACLRVRCTVHLFAHFYTCSKVHTIKSLELFTFLKPEMWYATHTQSHVLSVHQNE